MSNPLERLKETQANWFSARDNRKADLAKTKTEDEVKSIEDNCRDARAAYEDALESGLAANSTSIEDAYARLAQANNAVRASRERLDAVSALLPQLTAATNAAKELAEAAKS